MRWDWDDTVWRKHQQRILVCLGNWDFNLLFVFLITTRSFSSLTHIHVLFTAEEWVFLSSLLCSHTPHTWLEKTVIWILISLRNSLHTFVFWWFNSIQGQHWKKLVSIVYQRFPLCQTSWAFSYSLSYSVSAVSWWLCSTGGKMNDKALRRLCNGTKITS